MGGRNSSRSPARAPPVSDFSRHSLTQQLSRSVTDWLSGEDKNRRREVPRSDDRRSRPIERSRDTGRGRQRSVSTATESSLVSHSRSSSRNSGRSPPPTEVSRSSYTSYTSSSHHKSRRSHHHHHHHQRRRDRSYSSSRSRSSSRERTQREKKKALKSGLLLLSSVAAATAAAQKYWSKDGDREDREPDPRDSRSGHHRQRSTNERVQEGAERARDEVGGRREGMKSRETAAARHSAERRDSPATRKRGVPAPNPDLSNRERLGLNDRAGIKTTPTSTAPASVTSSMRVEPPRSVYHPHYEDTQYAAAPEDDDAIWVPVEERVTLNSRGETVVETIERRVAPPSEVAAKRKSHGGKKGGERERDVFRVVERHQIMDEWDPRWKKY